MPYLSLNCNRQQPERYKHCIVKDENLLIPDCYSSTQPGDFTERGCPFLGCRVVICGQIKNVVHLIHSPVGCAYYSWDYRVDSQGYCFTTDVQERDIIFGGEKKLLDAIIVAAKEFDADAIFVYETCSTGLIGDDVQAVAKAAEKIVNKPVIAFNCAGFRGISQNAGHKVANSQLFKLVGSGCEETQKMSKKMSFDVNLIGDFNAKDAKCIEKLLNKLGIKVICSFTANATIDKIRSMHLAKLNIVQCSRSSIFIAEMMKEKFGIPYIETNLFGVKNCVKAISTICRELGIDESRVKRVIDEYLENTLPKIEGYKKKLEGKRAFICHGAQRSLYWIEPLSELGIEIAGIATFFGKREDYEKIVEKVSEGTVIIDNPSIEELEEVLLDVKPDLFISDDKVKPFILKLGIPFINGRGQGKAYSGFEGFVNFARDVYYTISSGVWKLVRS